MSIETARRHLAKWGRDKDVIEKEESTATVELAAAVLGVIPARIAKTISLRADNPGGALLIVAAGDVKLDNKKFKTQFGVKARMLNADEVLACTGHAVGGVCPFGLPEGVEVYLDDSLKRFKTIFPACGSSNSLIELNLEELAEYSTSLGWVDVCVSRETLA